MSDVPSFTQFNPRLVPWQYRALCEIENFDYSQGVYEVLLSGAVGSAKSLLMAHIVVKHCVRYPKARVLVGRLSLPDLKNTILKTIFEHMEGDFVEDQDFVHNKNEKTIYFSNGSEILYMSWHDKKFKKFDSLKLSMAAIEELTENAGEYWEAIRNIYERIGRLPHVPQNLFIGATNPDGPEHPAYKHFILEGIEH